MNGLLFLIPAALGLGLLAMGAFVWSVKNRQYDDIEGAAARVLLDDDLDDEDS